MEKRDTILDELPSRLKKARKEQGLSLDAIANISGVSRSMVSQIERGESSPTIATLWNLTQALNVDFAGLLDQGPLDNRIEVLKADQVPSIDNMGDGCQIKILSPPEDVGTHEVYDISLRPGSSLKSQPHGRGTTEQLTVLSGSVRVMSGEAVAELQAGDTAHYAADLSHEISANNEASRVFLVVKAKAI